MIDDAEIKRLRALCDSATPGPWHRYETLVCGSPGQPAESAMDVADCALGSEPEDSKEWAAAIHDARFIAECRSAVPALLDAVEASLAPEFHWDCQQKIDTLEMELSLRTKVVENVVADRSAATQRAARAESARSHGAYVRELKAENVGLRAALIEALDLAADANGDLSSCSYSVPIGDRVLELRKLASEIA
jgi:hypothetical protein